ncbi:fasciclin domain-containing protein [uncultured Tateyamaria sp.]|uniref:fasciclin domain-containing protein n=1 Tax=uncultured Tateyamaria sp. TaxID=455651 RepID=UPI00260A43FD|nr:fasciclin domain-containing protein [uncultured Tateyamaria sp.]
MPNVSSGDITDRRISHSSSTPKLKNAGRYYALDLLRNDARFSIFIEMINACEFDENLKCLPCFTIFAPTNEAFHSFDLADLYDFINHANRQHVEHFVSQFFVPKRSHSSQFLDRRVWAINMLGRRMLVAATQRPTYENARIATFDFNCIDGSVHVINEMISGQRVYRPIHPAVSIAASAATTTYVTSYDTAA